MENMSFFAIIALDAAFSLYFSIDFLKYDKSCRLSRVYEL